MCGQIEQAEGMLRREGRDPQSQIGDACHRVRLAEYQLPSGLFDRDLAQGNAADLAHRIAFPAGRA